MIKDGLNLFECIIPSNLIRVKEDIRFSNLTFSHTFRTMILRGQIASGHYQGFLNEHKISPIQRGKGNLNFGIS